MLVIVDGHNLIGCLPEIDLADADDEEKLLFRLRQYRARTGRKLEVMFDPGSSYKPGNRQSRGGITVQYAPAGKTADQMIINRLRKLKEPGQTLVISSDRVVQQAARVARARVMSAGDFAAQLTLPTPAANHQMEMKLSGAEVEAWLNLFGEDE